MPATDVIRDEILPYRTGCVADRHEMAIPCYRCSVACVAPCRSMQAAVVWFDPTTGLPVRPMASTNGSPATRSRARNRAPVNGRSSASSRWPRAGGPCHPERSAPDTRSARRAPPATHAALFGRRSAMHRERPRPPDSHTATPAARRGARRGSHRSPLAAGDQRSRLGSAAAMLEPRLAPCDPDSAAIAGSAAARRRGSDRDGRSPPFSSGVAFQ